MLSPGELLPVAEALAKNVVTVRENPASADLAGDPAQLPIRAHEVIEDALRDHLSCFAPASLLTWKPLSTSLLNRLLDIRDKTDAIMVAG